LKKTNKQKTTTLKLGLNNRPSSDRYKNERVETETFFLHPKSK